MAGYGWSLRHGNEPQRPTHIACRICDRVFMNAPALIDHIESHMAEDRIRTAAPRNLVNLMPYTSLRGSRFNPGFNPTSVAKRPINVARAPFYLMGKRFATKGLHEPYILEAQDYGVMERRNEDCTRPFLQQLDKPISYAPESKNMGDDDNHNSANLDLSLKL